MKKTLVKRNMIKHALSVLLLVTAGTTKCMLSKPIDDLPFIPHVNNLPLRRRPIEERIKYYLVCCPAEHEYCKQTDVAEPPRDKFSAVMKAYRQRRKPLKSRL